MLPITGTLGSPRYILPLHPPTGRPIFSGSNESDVIWSISRLMGICPRHISIAQGRPDCKRILLRISECDADNFKQR